MATGKFSSATQLSSRTLCVTCTNIHRKLEFLKRSYLEGIFIIWQHVGFCASRWIVFSRIINDPDLQMCSEQLVNSVSNSDYCSAGSCANKQSSVNTVCKHSLDVLAAGWNSCRGEHDQRLVALLILKSVLESLRIFLRDDNRRYSGHRLESKHKYSWCLFMKGNKSQQLCCSVLRPHCLQMLHIFVLCTS